MESKISLGELSSSLSRTTGKTKKVCDDFLREFFKLVTETLQIDDSLKIKGLGTFKVALMESRNAVNVNTGAPMEIAGYKKVVFTPSKELAKEINTPFEEFESLEIEDDEPDELLTDYALEEDHALESVAPAAHPNEDATSDISNENEVADPILEAGSVEEADDDDITLEAYSQTITREDEKIPEVSHQPAPETSTVYQEPGKSRFGIGFLIGALSTFAVCAVIFIIGCFFDWWPENLGRFQSNQKSPTEVAVESDNVTTAAEEEQQEAEPVVFDTVSTTRYLTTIAREHYGDFNFWPYIYLENESILGHPDRITPGTQVVVPQLSKYGVDPENKDDVAQAKKKGLEIYSRFK